MKIETVSVHLFLEKSGRFSKGMAAPIFYWLILNKRGNSNQRERITLLKHFVSHFGSDLILGILGDREFIGGVWWKWLTDNQIPYLIRIKENQFYEQKGKSRHVKARFLDLKPHQQRRFRKPYPSVVKAYG